MAALSTAVASGFQASAPSRAASRRIDWSGLWFRIVEKDGEFIGMRGGRKTQGGHIDWVFPSHAEYDGLGGFVHILREAFPGRDIQVPVRASRAPSFLKRAAAFMKLCAHKPVPAAAWKGYDTNWRGRRPNAGNEFATMFFEQDVTRRLNAKARAKGVSLNSLLMHTLARASQSDLEAGPKLWMMPVNMRGPVKLDRDTANQTGYLQISIADDASLADVQDQLKLALRRRDHWATWAFFNISQLIGFAGICRVFKFQMKRFQNRPFVGSFSNLGAWKGVGDWCVCPLVTLTAPVGVGAIICDGRLALTVEAHASIKRETGWTQSLMDRWTALLQSAD
jgi:hypothetical protein